MTLVETLVVIAIIGTLVALLLPAVNFARNAARRSHCAANLRQIGIALSGYKSTYGVFPAGMGDSGSIHVKLLPFVEHDDVYDLFNFSRFSRDIANQTVARRSLGIYLCPSDPLGNVVDPSNSLSGATNYLGCYGRGAAWFGFDGMFQDVELGPIRAADVPDGLSRTTAISEILVASGQHDPLRSGFYTPETMIGEGQMQMFLDACLRAPIEAQGVQHHWERGRPWTAGSPMTTLYNHLLTPNRPTCTNKGLFIEGAHTAASLHSGGANALFADGSVTFISDRIDADIWRAMASRNGRDDL